jgi:hypothetical protein
MKVAPILRRIVVVGATSTLLGLGLAFVATPAQAMRQECVLPHQMGMYWWFRYERARDAGNEPLAGQYFRMANAAWEVYSNMGCRP